MCPTIKVILKTRFDDRLSARISRRGYFNESELIQALQATDSASYQKERALFFKKTYNYGDGKATERVLKLIEAIMNQSL